MAMFSRRSLHSLSDESVSRKTRRSRTGTPPPSATRHPHHLQRPVPPPTSKTISTNGSTLYRNPLLRFSSRGSKPADSVHQDYIDDMLYRIALQKDVEVSEDVAEAPLLSTTSDLSVGEGLEERRKNALRGDGHKMSRFKNKRRIEVPWKSYDPFVKSEDLKQRAFRSFQMMIPETPKTPPPVRGTLVPDTSIPTSTILAPKTMNRSSGLTLLKPQLFSADLPSQPQKKKVSKARGADSARLDELSVKLERSPGRLEASGLLAHKSGRGAPSRGKMEAGPTCVRVVHESEYFKPTYKPLQPPSFSRNTLSALDDSRASAYYARHIMNNNPPLSTVRMNTASSDHRSTFARLEEQRRRDLMALTRPTSTRSKYFGTGRETGKPEVKSKVYLPNPHVTRSKTASRAPSTAPLEKPTQAQKHQKLQVELQNMQRVQYQRRIHPSMMFPFHVPGPKQDNIFIGNYVGSDEEDDEEKTD